MTVHPHEHPVALITGASAGIGRGIAHALAQRGWGLALVARDRSRLESLGGEIESQTPVRSEGARGGRAGGILIHPADMGDPAAPQRMVDACLERFGRLDALINNAGIAPLLPIPDTSNEAIDSCLAVNLRAPLLAIRAAWTALAAGAKLPNSPAGGSVVINISTMGTRDPFPGFFAYAASKAGVNLAARSVANEGAAHRIRGFAIAPGAVETAMLRSLFDEHALPADACLRPEEVASLAMDCIEGRHDGHNGGTLFIRRSEGGKPGRVALEIG
ncbi:MAG: SDR family NAD(P)-dependent oxidoreductase [Phycisphaerales bacterium]